jgi:hypothetical protein
MFTNHCHIFCLKFGRYKGFIAQIVSDGDEKELEKMHPLDYDLDEL